MTSPDGSGFCGLGPWETPRGLVVPAQQGGSDVLLATSFSTCVDESGPNTIRPAFCEEQASSQGVSVWGD